MLYNMEKLAQVDRNKYLVGFSRPFEWGISSVGKVNHTYVHGY